MVDGPSAKPVKAPPRDDALGLISPLRKITAAEPALSEGGCDCAIEMNKKIKMNLFILLSFANHGKTFNYY